LSRYYDVSTKIAVQGDAIAPDGGEEVRPPYTRDYFLRSRRRHGFCRGSDEGEEVTAGSGIGFTAGRLPYRLATTTDCGGGVVAGSLEPDAGDEFEARNARKPSKRTTPPITETNRIRIPPENVDRLDAVITKVNTQWTCQSHFATRREAKTVW